MSLPHDHSTVCVASAAAAAATPAEPFASWGWVGFKRPSRTVIRLCSWNRATRRPTTDGPWRIRVYRCVWSFFDKPFIDFVVTWLLFLWQDYLSASSDLQEVLQLDPNVQEAEQELETVTCLLRQSLMENGDKKTPKGKSSRPHT